MGVSKLGEKHEQTLKREVLEETGVHINVIALCDFVTSYWYNRGNHYHCIGPFYLCSYASGEVTGKNLSEHERDWQCRPLWLDIDEVMKRGFALTADWQKAMDVALKHPH